MYVIGDIQGCHERLQHLLCSTGGERLIFVGDIVNRGPQSLQALRTAKALGDRAVVLLGNHDLHLLAVAAGVRPLHADDTLQDILDAPDRDDLLDWLRQRPLAHAESGALFVHAGVLPQWSVSRTLELAAEVEARLRTGDSREFFARMYGNAPALWNESLTGDDRIRCVINALTRVRFVDTAGAMELRVKDGAAAAPAGFMPWFDHPRRASRETPVVFGHWSTLGLMIRDDAICLDSGCVWGGRLTALRWPQRTTVQVDCPGYRVPGSSG
jgi:bis(5'-nucleosyl)-tetraphosphatase (symmetrical)